MNNINTKNKKNYHTTSPNLLIEWTSSHTPYHMRAGSNFNMGQIFNLQTSTRLKFSTPRIMESFGFYSLERKVLLWWLSILFLPAKKKKTSTLLHTLLLKTSNNVFGGQILPLVAKWNPVRLIQRIFVGKMRQTKFLPYLDNKFKASTKLPKYSSIV